MAICVDFLLKVFHMSRFSVYINRAIKQAKPVIPGLIPADHGICDRHPVPAWIPAWPSSRTPIRDGMTTLRGCCLWAGDIHGQGKKRILIAVML